ncbi:MAG TPA: VWA domain-containing protein [Thermoanaerobaculia bacterium]|nr:VWA domain-containing protein [Thermoanaerobaculia bacterium]
MNVLPVALALFLGAPQSALQETIEVRIHNVDVVVTDAKGNAVVGLGADDFEVLEDGKPQKVTNFSAYAETATAPDPNASAATSPPATTQAPPPRTFVFFIDELSLVPATRDGLLASLRALTQSLRPDDRAAVVRPSEATEIALEWTSDHAAIEGQLEAALADAVQKKRSNGLARELYWYRRDLSGAASQDEARQVALRAAARTMQRVKQRLGTMRAIIASLAPLDGRKVLVGVTQSLSGEPGREFLDDYANKFRNESLRVSAEPLDALQAPDPRGHVSQTEAPGRRAVVRDLRPAIAEVARVASANGVTFYAIRPENDLTLMQAAPDLLSLDPDINRPGPQQPLPINNVDAVFMQNAIENTKSAVNPLVDITGGRHFAPNDRFEDATRRIVADLSSYYSLAYHAQGGVDRAHKIQVRVKNRPELKVLARGEVERKSAPRELTDRVVSSLIHVDSPNDLGIALRANRAAKSNTITIDVLIPIAALDFEHAGNVYRARYSAHYAVTGKATDFFSGVDLDRVVEIPARDWEKARQQHWTHSITVTGSDQDYRVAVGVMDLRSERSGIATMDVAR